MVVAHCECGGGNYRGRDSILTHYQTADKTGRVKSSYRHTHYLLSANTDIMISPSSSSSSCLLLGYLTGGAPPSCTQEIYVHSTKYWRCQNTARGCGEGGREVPQHNRTLIQPCHTLPSKHHFFYHHHNYHYHLHYHHHRHHHHYRHHHYYWHYC